MYIYVRFHEVFSKIVYFLNFYYFSWTNMLVCVALFMQRHNAVMPHYAYACWPPAWQRPQFNCFMFHRSTHMRIYAFTHTHTHTYVYLLINAHLHLVEASTTRSRCTAAVTDATVGVGWVYTCPYKLGYLHIYVCLMWCNS